MFPIQRGLRRSLNRLNLIVFQAYQLQGFDGTPVDKKIIGCQISSKISARSTPYQYRGRAQAILHGLCDERHRWPRITRREDGLKPVHRRVLFAMNELNNDWNKATRSRPASLVTLSVNTTRTVTQRYTTRLSNGANLLLRYPLVDGQGNFGSIDGDSAAAMRYTEIR